MHSHKRFASAQSQMELPSKRVKLEEPVDESDQLRSRLRGLVQTLVYDPKPPTLAIQPIKGEYADMWDEAEEDHLLSADLGVAPGDVFNPDYSPLSETVTSISGNTLNVGGIYHFRLPPVNHQLRDRFELNLYTASDNMVCGN